MNKTISDIINRKEGKRVKGFTLIELLVVVVIIGILAAVATPIYLNQRKAAWRATAVSDATNAALAIETARVQNGGTLNGVRFATGVDGKPMLITVGGASAPASASVPTPTAAEPTTLTTSGWATGDGGVGWQVVLGSDRFLVSGVPATVLDTPDPQLDLSDAAPSIRFATSDQLSRGEMTTMAADVDFRYTIASGRITIRFMPDSEGVQAAIADAKAGDLTLQIVLTTHPRTAPQAGVVYTNRVEATGSAPANSSYEVPAATASGDTTKSPVSPGNTEQAWVGKDSSGAECYAVMTTNKNIPSWAAVRTSAGLTTGTPPANGSAECPKPSA